MGSKDNYEETDDERSVVLKDSIETRRTSHNVDPMNRHSNQGESGQRGSAEWAARREQSFGEEHLRKSGPSEIQSSRKSGSTIHDSVENNIENRRTSPPESFEKANAERKRESKNSKDNYEETDDETSVVLKDSIETRRTSNNVDPMNRHSNQGES